VRAVNLIPGDQLGGGGRTARRSGGGAYAVLVLVGGLALLAFLYGQARRDVSHRRGQVASLNAQTQQAQAQAAGLAPYTSFAALREERERAVSQLVDARFDWAHAMHELGRVLPSNAAITSIDGTVGSASANGGGSSGSAGGAKAGASSVASVTPPGSVPSITVTGCALSQSDVALTLNRLRLIDGVTEVTLQTSAKSTSGGSGAIGQCPPKAAVFTAVLTFQPLPAGSSTTASALPVSAQGGSR
jgi:Tfp pilus assembly protein PilN